MLNSILCILLIPTILIGQTRSNTVSQIDSGKKIRLKSPEFRNALIGTPWIKGVVVKSSADTLIILSEVNNTLAIPVTSVNRIEAYDENWTQVNVDPYSTILVGSRSDLIDRGDIDSQFNKEIKSIAKVVTATALVGVLILFIAVQRALSSVELE